MYSDDIAEYGGMPNTNVSVITLGHPGTLPKVNKRAIEFAVKLGPETSANALNIIYNAADLLNKVAFGLIIWSVAVSESEATAAKK